MVPVEPMVFARCMVIVFTMWSMMPGSASMPQLPKSSVIWSVAHFGAVPPWLLSHGPMIPVMGSLVSAVGHLAANTVPTILPSCVWSFLVASLGVPETCPKPCSVQAGCSAKILMTVTFVDICPSSSSGMLSLRETARPQPQIYLLRGFLHRLQCARSFMGAQALPRRHCLKARRARDTVLLPGRAAAQDAASRAASPP